MLNPPLCASSFIKISLMLIINDFQIYCVTKEAAKIVKHIIILVL